MSLKQRPDLIVVDDDPQDRKLLATILERDGFGVATASNAAEARAQLLVRDFALVVTDLSMPGETGLSLVEHVLHEHPDTGVLIVSGQANPAEDVLELGIYGYLVKPFGIDQFLITVANALRRRDLERERREYERGLEWAVAARTTELRRSREQTVQRLASAMEYRDGDTGEHSSRVGRLAWLIARGLGLDTAHCELIRIATPLHDLGKIAIPDSILRKAGPLTRIERQLMETHAEMGHQLLAGSGEKLLELAATIAWTHHERPDGSGYPRGLKGDEIPIEGRIAAVADVFDALTSDRPYRPAFSVPEALEIVRNEGLDPVMVEMLEESLPLVFELVHVDDAA